MIKNHLLEFHPMMMQIELKENLANLKLSMNDN